MPGLSSFICLVLYISSKKPSIWLQLQTEFTISIVKIIPSSLSSYHPNWTACSHVFHGFTLS